MKRIILWLWLLVKRQLKTPAIAAFLIGMPMICMIIQAVPAMNEEGRPRVGIVVQGTDETAQAAAKQLVRGSYSVEFYQTASAEELTKDIAAGKTQHGYVFTKEFTEKLDENRYNGSILLIGEQSGFLSAMTNEIVFSELFRVYGLNIALNYVEKSDVFARVRPEAVSLVKNKYLAYGNSKDTFYLDFEMLDAGGQTTALAQADNLFPIRGVLSVLVFIAGLYGGVWWKIDCQDGVFLTLGRRFQLTSRILYILVPTVLFAVSAEFTLALTHTAAFPYEILKMMGYVVLIVAFVLVLTIIIPDSKLMVSVIPVLAVASLILCPIFINVTTIMPVAKYLSRLLVPYYYL